MPKKSIKTVFADVPSHINADEMERGILAYWESAHIFAQSLEQTKDGPLFTFYDGPPYATGKPHYGHILQSAIKDTVLRYKTMQGYHVPRRVGWDCHGLPVEVIVEKELKFKTKKDIEAYGIAKFNAKCRDIVFRYIDDFTTTLKRVGRWADYNNAYATLNRDYMESEWWVFKQLWDQGLVYQDFRSTPYCIRCATPLSNFEVSSNYHDTTDTAVYVLLTVNPKSLPHFAKALRGGRGANKQVSLLIWTTTPWTLPANVAVAINPHLEYVEVEHEGKSIILARDSMARVFGTDIPIKRVWPARELLNITYEPLYQFPVIASQAKQPQSHTVDSEIAASRTSRNDTLFRVVVGEHVTTGEGTGLVHIAPAFGEEDASVAQAEHLPVLRTVDTHGNFIDAIKPWAGKNIFSANPAVISDLKQRGLLLKEEHYTHSYPFCWRCDNPLIYYALETWFIRIASLKQRLLAANEKINWVPAHIKHGRFAKGIESAPDWAVSRNRFWSVPLPVWECDSCKQRVCIGSVEELQKLSGVKEIKDLHRPYIDEVTWECSSCHDDKKGTMHRVPEVLDVWFDSGAMPYAQWHYPFANKDFVEQGFPADFIAESIEMTRAWFYVLHVLAVALTTKDIGLGIDQPAYKNVIGSGLIFAEDGKKLSKKLKNYPDIEPTLQKYGADVLRLYLLSSSSLGEPYRFSEHELRLVQRSTYLILWNVYSFFVRYANVHQFTPPPQASQSTGASTSSHILDKWILARLKQLEHDVLLHASKYEIDRAARLFIPFIDDLSTWYVRRSRARFQRPVHSSERLHAFSTLYSVLTRMNVLIAPFMPFVAESMYRNLTGEASVHLQTLPDQAEALGDTETKLLKSMSLVRAIVSVGLRLRATAGIKVRQALSELTIQKIDEYDTFTADLLDIIRDEVNVKKVTVHQTLPTDTPWVVSEPSETARVALNTEITLELKHEGLAREIIRHSQVLRREAGYELNERIRLQYETDDAEIEAVLRTFAPLISDALQVDSITKGIMEADVQGHVKVNEHSLTLGTKRV